MAAETPLSLTTTIDFDQSHIHNEDKPDLAAEHSDSGYSASDTESSDTESLSSDSVTERYNTIKSFLRTPAGEKQILQSMTVETLLSEKCNWDAFIASGSTLVDSFAQALLVASSPISESTNLSRTTSSLKYKSLRNNLQHCASLGRSAFRDIDRRMGDVRNSVQGLNHENIRINKVLDQVQSGEVDETHLPSQLMVLLEISGNLIQHVEKMKERTDKWQAYVSEVKTASELRAIRLQQKQAALQESGRNGLDKASKLSEEAVQVANQQVVSIAGHVFTTPTNLFSSALLYGTTAENTLSSAQDILASTASFFGGSLGISLHSSAHGKSTTKNKLRSRNARIHVYRTILEERRVSLAAQREEISKCDKELQELSQEVGLLDPEGVTLEGCVLDVLKNYNENLVNFSRQIESLQLVFKSLNSAIDSLINTTEINSCDAMSLEDSPTQKHQRIESLRLVLLKVWAYYQAIDELVQTYSKLSTSYLMPGICQIAGYRSSMSTAKPILNFNGIKEILDSVHKNYIQFRTKACIDSFHEKRMARLDQELLDLDSLINVRQNSPRLYEELETSPPACLEADSEFLEADSEDLDMETELLMSFRTDKVVRSPAMRALERHETPRKVRGKGKEAVRTSVVVVL